MSPRWMSPMAKKRIFFNISSSEEITLFIISANEEDELGCQRSNGYGYGYGYRERTAIDAWKKFNPWMYFRRSMVYACALSDTVTGNTQVYESWKLIVKNDERQGEILRANNRAHSGLWYNPRSQQCCYACKGMMGYIAHATFKAGKIHFYPATLIGSHAMNIPVHVGRNSYILPPLLQLACASWVGDVTVPRTHDGSTCLCWEDIHLQLSPDRSISVQNLSGILKLRFTACSVWDTGKKVPHEIKYLSFGLSIFLPWVCRRHAECEMLEQVAWCSFLEPCWLQHWLQDPFSIDVSLVVACVSSIILFLNIQANVVCVFLGFCIVLLFTG